MFLHFDDYDDDVDDDLKQAVVNSANDLKSFRKNGKTSSYFNSAHIEHAS